MGVLVSIVVPVFNGMAHLEQAVHSMLNQTHTDLDIVLVDGGSTDGSRDWIHEVDDPRVRSKTMPHGTTAADNWTEASRAATGDFVKLLCQDDVLYPRATEEQLADLDAHPNALFAVAQRDIVDADGKVIYSGRGCAGLKAGQMNGLDALRQSYLHGTNVFGEPLAVLFRRPALDAALSWNDTRPFLLDLELYTRVLQEGPIVVRRAAIGAFRVSSSSWSTRIVKEQIEQLQHWQGEVGPTLAPPPSAFEKARARFMLHEQMALRRAAYRMVKVRGGFASPATLGVTAAGPLHVSLVIPVYAGEQPLPALRVELEARRATGSQAPPRALLASLAWDASNPLVLDLLMYAKVDQFGDVFVSKATLGAFRVTTRSWSTRLAGVQRHQFEKW